MVNEMEEGRKRIFGIMAGILVCGVKRCMGRTPAIRQAAIQRRTCDSAMNRSENWEGKIGENEAEEVCLQPIS